MKKIYLILTVVIFFGTICTAQNNKSETTTLRVQTFNILHGATTKGDFDLDKIASIDYPNLTLEEDKKIIPIGGSYRDDLNNKIQTV